MPRSTPTPGVPTRPGRLVLALVALLLIAGTFVPGGMLWGVHAARFLPTWVGVGACLLLVASFFFDLRIGSTRDAAVPGSRQLLWAVGAASACALLALVAGPATQLLGDGQLVARTFQLALDGDDTVLVRGAEAILREDPIARGTTLLYFVTTRIGHSLAGASALSSLSATSAIVGALFVGALVWIAGAWRIDGDLRRWILTMALLSPASLLLLGYVENYTPLQAVLGLYTFAALGAIEGRVRILVPIALIVLAFLLHVQAIVLLPSTIVLLASRLLTSPWRERVLHGLPAVASIGALLVAIVLAQAFTDRYLLPLWGSGRTLLSTVHLLDYANALILVFPLAPLVLVLFVWVVRVLHVAAGSPESVARSFVAAYLGPGLVYLFVIDPELGMARDWDRGAFLLWGWVAMGMVALVQARGAGVLDAGALRRLATPALGVAFVSTASWIVVNASAGATIERVAWIVEHDDHGRTHGYEALARYHSDRAEFGTAGFWAERGYEHGRNPRLATLAAQHFEKAQLVDEARAVLERAFARRPEDHRVRHELVRLVADTEDWPRVLLLAREGAKLHPDRAVYCFFMGESLRHLGRTSEATRVFETCLQMDGLPTRARVHIEAALKEMQEAPAGVD